MDPVLDGLTAAQREAVQHVEGPLLVLAGPGSGKTRVITHRIAYLIRQGVPSDQILALTFTNKAADEMRTRVAQLVPKCPVWVGTFHRFCASLLRKYARFVGLQENYTIYDAEDSLRALRQTLANCDVDTARYSPEAIGAAISWAKNRVIPPERYEPRPGHPLGLIVQRVYPAYQALLLKANAADFDDLLFHGVTLLREHDEIRSALDHRYRFILVDEYQDTNLAQYLLTRALSVDHPNLAVTGDPDQSIYGWRGANLNNILEFEKDFPDVHVVRLEQNYRSTQRILRVASGLIAHNIHRKPKDLYTENGQGVPVRLVTYADQREEAWAIAGRIGAEIAAGKRQPRDYAIFYRINALSRMFEFALREQGIPYQLVHGLEFFQRKEIKDVLAYLRLINNPDDDLALLRVINAPPGGIGKSTLARLSQHATQLRTSLLEAARQSRHLEGLRGPIRSKLLRFVELIDRLSARATGSVEQIVRHVLAESGYQDQFAQSPSEEDQQRLANIEELLTVAREFEQRAEGEPTLEAFLEQTSLVSDTDQFEAGSDRVTLMTLHASKGLEFPVVYLVAVEEGLLPHERSRDSLEELEEERRLMFVGMTRAKQELQISWAVRREFRGRCTMAIPSRFLMELPRDEMEVIHHDDEVVAWTDPMGPDTASMVAPPTAPTDGSPPTIPVGADLGSIATPSSPIPGLSAAGLKTAAELAVPQDPSAPDPEAFSPGMLVWHPQNGLGLVVGLSGFGGGRVATVDFVCPPRRMEFPLAASALRPLTTAPTARRNILDTAATRGDDNDRNSLP